MAYPSTVFKVPPAVPPGTSHRLHRRETKLRLEELAMEELPRHMGQKYTDVVLSCLTCSENPNFGADLDDSSGLVIGARFIKLVRTPKDWT